MARSEPGLIIRTGIESGYLSEGGKEGEDRWWWRDHWPRGEGERRGSKGIRLRHTLPQPVPRRMNPKQFLAGRSSLML